MFVFNFAHSAVENTFLAFYFHTEQRKFINLFSNISLMKAIEQNMLLKPPLCT